ncbi:VOC family protein [Enteractinococcus coprophilus]|uniref:Glyoxalase/bleomycin resistance protein/dioxygenase superfamily protein n=1 Tax=Enteractinococcus coprophilus TaxID=1027633 RepID=A0A543APE9_9MICC|nr:VOC family protein [Enteractinococcus coprophilus]TQL74463.1 glyoxalase/bleomycin resistance protein/dioxygenase superfamily protein [Enteractinococcus coprophilus]
MTSQAQQPHIDFDHTSFAVHDALASARQLRQDFGATPITGESLDAFRYLMMYIGSEAHGTKVELIEPTGDGFLSHYLDKRGESPHHLTFSVQNLRDVVVAVREHGFGVVDEHYDHPAWQEAFIRPDATHRTIIQLASSDRQYLSAQQLLTSYERDVQAMPHIHGARNHDWWTNIWETQPGHTQHIGPTVLKSADLEKSHTLFGTILQGQPRESQRGMIYAWSSGAIEVVPSDRPGIVGIKTSDSSGEFITLGLTTPGLDRA